MNLIEVVLRTNEAARIFEEIKNAIRDDAQSLEEVELYMAIIQGIYDGVCKLFEHETQDLRETFENGGEVGASGKGWDELKEIYLSKIEEFSNQNQEGDK